MINSSDITPVMETGRLRLRGAMLSDFDAILASRNSPEVMAQFGNKPVARDDCWRRFLVIPGHWVLHGFGYWIVEEKETGAFVGEVGLAEFRRDMTPSIEGTLEAGWILTPDHHGKGYGTEAVRATVAWARSHFPAMDITCIISPTNTASIALARKTGFVERVTADFHGEPVLVFDWRG